MPDIRLVAAKGVTIENTVESDDVTTLAEALLPFEQLRAREATVHLGMAGSTVISATVLPVSPVAIGLCSELALSPAVGSIVNS